MPAHYRKANVASIYLKIGAGATTIGIGRQSANSATKTPTNISKEIKNIFYNISSITVGRASRRGRRLCAQDRLSSLPAFINLDSHINYQAFRRATIGLERGFCLPRTIPIVARALQEGECSVNLSDNRRGGDDNRNRTPILRTLRLKLPPLAIVSIY